MIRNSSVNFDREVNYLSDYRLYTKYSSYKCTRDYVNLCGTEGRYIADTKSSDVRDSLKN